MDLPARFGRICFAIGMAAFGVQYLLYGRFVGGLPPAPPWTPGAPPLAYLTGAVLIAAGVSIAIRWKAHLSAILLGILFISCVVFLHGLHPLAILHNGVDRTRAFEPLALGAAALVLAGTLPTRNSGNQVSDVNTNRLIVTGCLLFAFSMVVFGIQHFMYAAFIATLIPSWIPAHLFWVYLTGAGFIAAAFTIAIRKFAWLGATLLGLMFLLWTLLLHAPRVARALHNGDEWASLFVALASAGASFVIAGAATKRD
jgi:uncharacterized membrane protein